MNRSLVLSKKELNMQRTPNCLIVNKYSQPNPLKELLLLFWEIEDFRYQLLRYMKSPICRKVDTMADQWINQAIQKSTDQNLDEFLIDKKILPIVTSKDEFGREIKTVSESGLPVNLACLLTYTTNGFSFTVKMVNDWLVVKDVKKFF